MLLTRAWGLRVPHTVLADLKHVDLGALSYSLECFSHLCLNSPSSRSLELRCVRFRAPQG